ncbi:MAG: hypothetical protein STSR0003_11900 [Smithella sp.]|jgi:hypothetical protein
MSPDFTASQAEISAVVPDLDDALKSAVLVFGLKARAAAQIAAFCLFT